MESSLAVVRSVTALRHRVNTWHQEGHRVALVPTMGALHAGHMALMKRALVLADRVVASIFVNPTQFGPNEDFTSYPRRETEDATLLVENGVHGLYLPPAAEMYPEGFATLITIGGPAEGLCGTFRPGHFNGVATVVTKLLLQARPDVAVFGEKDYQQLQVIRRLVKDLDIPVEIDGVPTAREADGLALSSRNAYLTPAERAIAPVLHQTLTAMAERLAAGGPVAEQEAWGADRLLSAGFGSIDYLEVRDAVALLPMAQVTAPARILVAARLGKTRLIDNVPVRPK